MVMTSRFVCLGWPVSRRQGIFVRGGCCEDWILAKYSLPLRVELIANQTIDQLTVSMLSCWFSRVATYMYAFDYHVVFGYRLLLAYIICMYVTFLFFYKISSMN